MPARMLVLNGSIAASASKIFTTSLYNNRFAFYEFFFKFPIIEVGFMLLASTPSDNCCHAYHRPDHHISVKCDWVWRTDIIIHHLSN